eukprot:SAG31_NODE_3711_length_3960_cov_5.475265_5_plen_482_part_01
MLKRLLEIIRNGKEFPEVVVAGAWAGLACCISARRSVAQLACQSGIFELAVQQLREMGGPTQWITVSCGKGEIVNGLINALSHVLKLGNTGANPAERPDTQIFVDCGALDQCITAADAFASRGGTDIEDINCFAFGMSLSLVSKCGARHPAVEDRVRRAAGSLSFCLEHDLDYARENGGTSGTTAAGICAVVFGRDEDSAGFSFSQDQIDSLLTWWSSVMRGDGWNKPKKPTEDTVHVLDLCISDTNKQKLLRNPNFLPYMVESLMLDPKHPRANLSKDTKDWIRATHTECFAQLAVFEPGRQALIQNPAVASALEQVLGSPESSETTKAFARSALLAMSDQKPPLQSPMTGQSTQRLTAHIMVSYCWNEQDIVTRIARNLQRRGYKVWLDIDQMKGSTLMSMSQAIDDAGMMLYCVSLRYKESVNCRMEAMYAHQSQLDMVPLMMQKDYTPKGWLGMLVGTRLWYPFYGAADEDEVTFDKR